METNNSEKEPIVVAVSGGFDPVHIGHIRMFEEAKALGHKLVVILNNDNWLKKKKGYVFMSQEERAEVIRSLRPVDEVILTGHGPDTEDMTVCAELAAIKPHIFCNGGDRKPHTVPSPETQTCAAINCKMVYNVGFGGKVQSSSWLVNKLKEKKNQIQER
jgi:D-beta-D-heptose 7-phosphate kinase/D-beta-D-heptose 1-phosphate adenosyltransferase